MMSLNETVEQRRERRLAALAEASAFGDRIEQWRAENNIVDTDSATLLHELREQRYRQLTGEDDDESRSAPLNPL